MRRYPVSFLIALLLHVGFFLLLFLTMADIWTRGWMGTPGR